MIPKNIEPNGETLLRILELKTFYDTKLTKKSKLVKWSIKKIFKNSRKIQKRKV